AFFGPFFFSYRAPAESYTLSLHDALPICCHAGRSDPQRVADRAPAADSARHPERKHRPGRQQRGAARQGRVPGEDQSRDPHADEDRKSTRLNSSHVKISYAVFCLKKKKNK